jgi:predicted HicB family RNase H-like nuclease
MIEYKGYSGVCEYDPEIEAFTGHVVDLRDQIYFEGTSVKELKASMTRAVDHYLAVCKRRGEPPDRPFSGRFNVRLPADLHRRVAKAAAASGASMNEWVIEALREKVGEDLDTA